MKGFLKFLAFGAVAAAVTPFSVKKDDDGNVSIQALLYKLDIVSRKTENEAETQSENCCCKKDVYISFPGVDLRKPKKEFGAENFDIEDAEYNDIADEADESDEAGTGDIL